MCSLRGMGPPTMANWISGAAAARSNTISGQKNTPLPGRPCASACATSDRGAASGMYLASYFLGGIAGSLALGWLYDAFGWGACVAGIGLALTTAAVLAAGLTLPEGSPSR